MTAIKSMKIRCDTCGAMKEFADAFPTATAARSEARATGWRAALPGGEDRCPACVASLRHPVGTELRRICWPQFDGVCLEGGCGYCNANPYRTLGEIHARIRDEPKMLTLLRAGWRRDWGNTEKIIVGYLG